MEGQVDPNYITQLRFFVVVAPDDVDDDSGEHFHPSGRGITFHNRDFPRPITRLIG